MNDKVKSLLLQTEKIIEKYDAIEKVTGGKFNIFSILERDRSETRHSRFLAELLNPKGSHGQEGLYLKLFYEILSECIKEQKSSFDSNLFSEQTTVSTEQVNNIAGKVGFIDIVVENKDYAIVIENKIDAGDQPEQLWRYAESKKNKTILLVYLTPDGREPSLNSKGSLKTEEILLLSYANHIVKWLNECIQASAKLPSIRETLVQYEKLIRKMTDQNDRDMEKEMTELLLKDENIKIAQHIYNALPKAKATLELGFWKKVDELLTQKFSQYGFENSGYEDDSEIISLLLNRYKQGVELIWFSYPKEYAQDKYFYFGIGSDGHKDKLYIGCYPHDKEGSYLGENAAQECIKLLEYPFDTKKHYLYFGEKRDFYGEGALELINEVKCDELAQETAKDLEPILQDLNKRIDTFFSKSS